jgi:D-alanine-D-alanine ligase
MTMVKVAVIAGGPSSEASVSRASAAGVKQALEQAGHSADVVELEASLPSRLVTGGYDVAFPAVHGAMGEDGCLQGLLEVVGLPYVGSGVLASALAMSKPHAKVQFRAAALPVARDCSVTPSDDLESLSRRVRAELGRAVVVKPANGGSAIGVETIRAEVDDGVLVQALERAFALGPGVLVEEFKVGKEVTCAVIEDERGARALPPTLIEPKAGAFYDFRSKYAPAGSAHVCPAPFSDVLTARIQTAAVLAHSALGCRDLSRVDFVVDDVTSEITLLEVNTLPGMTATSLYPEAAAAAGISFPSLCDGLVQRALSRPRFSVPDAPPMPT